jgi:hypothetical protein
MSPEVWLGSNVWSPKNIRSSELDAEESKKGLMNRRIHLSHKSLDRESTPKAKRGVVFAIAAREPGFPPMKILV